MLSLGSDLWKDKCHPEGKTGNHVGKGTLQDKYLPHLVLQSRARRSFPEEGELRGHGPDLSNFPFSPRDDLDLPICSRLSLFITEFASVYLSKQ